MTPTPIIRVYGIPNCETVKKARAWLAAAGIDHAFQDYKKLGADAERLARWAAVVGWERLLNRSSTTFRKLPEGERDGLDDPSAIALMVAHPSSIRRPVVEHPGGLLVGFDPAAWSILTATK